jgi:hypothetical protein
MESWLSSFDVINLAASAGKFDIRQAGQFDDHGASGKLLYP